MAVHAALKQYVLNQPVFFVLIHTDWTLVHTGPVWVYI